MSFQSFKEKMAAAKAAREAGLPAQPLATAPAPVLADPKPIDAPPANSFLAKLAARKAEGTVAVDVPPWEPAPETVVEAVLDDPTTLLDEPQALPPVVQALPEVITAANLVPKLEVEEVGGETAAGTIAIQQRISELQSLNGVDLKASMAKLRAMLLDNPSACALLLPEDAGQMVAALRRMTNNKVAQTLTASKPKKEKAVKLDAPMTHAQMQAALDEWD